MDSATNGWCTFNHLCRKGDLQPSQKFYIPVWHWRYRKFVARIKKSLSENMQPHPMPLTTIPTYEPLYAKLLATPLRMEPRWKRKWVHETRHYPNFPKRDKCCRKLMNEITSDIAEVSFLYEYRSHELRTKLRACQTTAVYRTCSLNQNFRSELEGPQ